jgi:hypothetical protein
VADVAAMELADTATTRGRTPSGTLLSAGSALAIPPTEVVPVTG